MMIMMMFRRIQFLESTNFLTVFRHLHPLWMKDVRIVFKS